MKQKELCVAGLGDQTLSIHAGEFPDPITGASAPNLVMSTTFVVEADTGFSVEGMGENEPFVYTRWGNPTIAHNANARLAVDSTFATPAGTKPLALGADFVIHSLTKYLGGHGDALGGAILGRAADLAPLRKKTAIRLGGTLSPFNAWLILRGLATFPLRMKAHEENALKVAAFLESHPKVVKLIYPGLPSHPQHELAQRQMKNFSGMVTFQTEKGKETAIALAKKLKIIHYAVSLGHHRSLIFYLNSEYLLTTSFRLDTPKQLESWKTFAGEGIFRLSVGLENAEDIIADLEQALA